MPDGGAAYEYDKGELEDLRVCRGEVHFMSSSGKELDYHKVCGEVGKAAWNDAYAHFRQHGERETVLEAFAAEYKMILTATDKRVGRGKLVDRAAEDAVAELRKMPVVQRDAWLAERLGLVYMPDGRDGWDKTENARNGALFIDSEGEERQFLRVIRGINWQPWYRAGWLRKRYAGVTERIVMSFAPELQAMKAAAKRRAELRSKAD